MGAVSFLALVLVSYVEIVQGEERALRNHRQDHLHDYDSSLGQIRQQDEAETTPAPSMALSTTSVEPSPGPSTSLEPSTSNQPTTTPSSSPTRTGLIERIREFFTFDTIYCEDNLDLPFCPMPNDPEERGMWVCRTLLDDDNNQLTRQSTCINPLFSLVNQDECGCCGETCPDLTCSCLCTVGGAQGVSVAFTAPGEQQYVPSCFPNDVARRLLASDTGFWTCTESDSCPEPLIGQLV